MMKSIRTILVANRGEIAIRVMRAASEMGIRTVAIYAEEDKFALHRFKADESYCVGMGKKPIAAYLDIKDIIRIAKEAKVDAIHPGYGFYQKILSLQRHVPKPIFNLSARCHAPIGQQGHGAECCNFNGVPVALKPQALPNDLNECHVVAAEVGYPLMLKASWGGGGRSMRVVEHEQNWKMPLMLHAVKLNLHSVMMKFILKS